MLPTLRILASLLLLSPRSRPLSSPWPRHSTSFLGLPVPVAPHVRAILGLKELIGRFLIVQYSRFVKWQVVYPWQLVRKTGQSCD